MCLFLPNFSMTYEYETTRAPFPVYILGMYFPHFFLAPGMFVLAASEMGIFKLIFHWMRKSVSY